MKISKLYSNDKEVFKDIEFDVKSSNFALAEDHSVGKTTLFHIIDFTLLKSSKPSFFSNQLIKSKNLTFYIELLLDDNRYLTIKRPSFGTKNICITTHQSSSDFRGQPDNAFGCKEGRKKALAFLDETLNLNGFGLDFKIRDYVAYFMRDQDNQSDVFRLNKFTRSKDIEWKPKIAGLVGVSPVLVKQKYDIENQIQDYNNKIKHLEAELGSHKTPEAIQKIIDIYRGKKDEKELRYKNFDFYLAEKDISIELVKETESKVSKLNERRNSLIREIEYIESSITNELSLNIQDIDNLFEEMSVNFPDGLRQNYSQVINFNKQIATERKEILLSNKAEFEIEIEEINSILEKLNSERSRALSILKDTDTMNKFKGLEREIIELETSIKIQEDKLNKFAEIEKYQAEIIELEKSLITTIDSIKLQKENPVAQEIDRHIRFLCQTVFGEDGAFSIGFNNQNNIEFDLSIASSGDFENDKDKGKTIRKLLCFIFASSVLLTYKTEPTFFRFLMFDSPFDGDKNNYQEGLWNAINHLSNHGIQTLISTITDEIKNPQIQQEIIDNHTVSHLTEECKLLGSF